MIAFNPIDWAWFLLSKRDSAVSRFWFATRIGWRNADFEHQAGMDSDLCICSCFTFVHPMILRPLGQWNGIWSWTKSYEIIWNHLNSYKVNALNLRTLPNVAAGYARSVPVPMLHISKTVNKTVASWGFVDDFDDDFDDFDFCWMWICSFATLPSAWRDEPDPTRSDQMGPGTGHGSHGLYKRWPKICDFAKESNHLAQKRMATNAIPTLCLSVVISCT